MQNLSELFDKQFGAPVAPTGPSAPAPPDNLSLAFDKQFSAATAVAEPPVFDPEGTGYDDASAARYGLTADETGHFPSRVPETGLLLKGRGHKTWPLTVKGEKEAGYEIYKGPDKRYYSRRKTPVDWSKEPTIPVDLTGQSWITQQQAGADPQSIGQPTIPQVPMESASKQMGGLATKAREKITGYLPNAKELGVVGKTFLDTIRWDTPSDAGFNNRSMFPEGQEYWNNEVGEILDRARWVRTYIVSLGGRLGPKGLKGELTEQAAKFSGLGPVVVPATTQTAQLALEWGWLYPQMFKAAGLTTESIKRIPQVAKAMKTLEASGGLSKVAAKFPRAYTVVKNAGGAFVKGEMVGQTLGLAESVGKDMDPADILWHMNKQGAQFGLIASVFSVVSSADQAIAIKRLRNQMLSRGLQQVRQMSQGVIGKPGGKAKMKSLKTFEDAMVKYVDNVVAAYEAELTGAVKGELYKNIRGKAPRAQQAINDFLQNGYRPELESFAGKSPLKTGMGQRPPVDVLRGEPTTRTGEVVKATGEAVRHPVKGIKQAVKEAGLVRPRPSAEAVSPKGKTVLPVPPTQPPAAKPPAKAVPGVKPTKPLNVMQQRQVDALAKFPEADVVEGTMRVRMKNAKGAAFQVPADQIQKKLDAGFTLVQKAAQVEAQVEKPVPVTQPPPAKEVKVKPVAKRPLVDPHASAIKQDKQLRAQQAWDKEQPPTEAKPAPTDKGEQVKGKEPWEMREDEWLRVTSETKYFTPAPGSHEQYVRDAISEGKPVPAEVLKDYPDLFKPAPTEVAKGKEKVIAAVVKIGEQTFEGTSHAEAVQKAVDAGVAQFTDKGILEKIGEPGAEIASDLFKTSTGQIVDRIGASKITGGKMFAEAIKTIKPAPTEAAKEVEALPPAQQKTVADLEQDAQKPADINIVFPKERKLKATVKHLEIGDEKKKVRDFGNGFGMVGKNLVHIAPDGTAKLFSRDFSSEESQRVMFGLLDKGIDTNVTEDKLIEQMQELAGGDKSNLRNFLNELAAAETPLSDIFMTPRKFGARTGKYSLDAMKSTIAARLGGFANTFPEFKINPTFTIDKDGMLVFKDHFKIRFYPEHFGIDHEKVKVGQTIRFDLESFDIKAALSKKQKKEVAMFTGPKKVLAKTKKFVKTKPETEAERRRINKKYEKLYKSRSKQSRFADALDLIADTDKEHGGATEENITDAVKKGYSLGRTIKQIEVQIQQAAKDQAISIVKVGEMIASVKPPAPKPTAKAGKVFAAPPPQGEKLIGGRQAGGTTIIPDIAKEAVTLGTKFIKHPTGLLAATSRLLRKNVRRARNYIATLGNPGKALAKDMDDIEVQVTKNANNDMLDIRKVNKGLGWKSRQRVTKIINGVLDAETQPGYLVERANALREILDRSMSEAASIGMTRIVKGKKIPIAGSGKAFPQVPNAKGVRFLKEAQKVGKKSKRVFIWAQQQVQAGKFESIDNAIKALQGFQESRLRGLNRYLESARVELPEEFVEWDSARVLHHLLESNWMTVEGVRKWGDKFNLVNSRIEQIKTEQGTKAANDVKVFLQTAFGVSSPASTETQQISNTLRAYQFHTKVALSLPTILRNMTDRIAKGWTIGGISANVKAGFQYPPFINQMIKAGRKAEEDMIRKGAVFGHGSLAEGYEAGNIITELAAHPFSASERGNQVYIALVKYHQLIKDIQTYHRRTGKNNIITRTFNRIGVKLQDPTKYRIGEHGGERLVEALEKGETVTEDHFIEILHRTVKDKAFPMVLTTKPLWYDTQPLIKIMVQFKTWPMQQTAMIWNDVVKYTVRTGDLRRLLGFIIGTMIAGELYNIARDFLFDKDESLLAQLRKDNREIGKAMLNDLLDGGVVGVIADFSYGIYEWIMGPSLSTGRQIKRTAVAIYKRPELTGAALKRLIVRDITPVRQIQTLIDKIDRNLVNKNNITKDYFRIRSWAYDYRDGYRYPEFKDRAIRYADDLLYGKVRYIEGENTLAYQSASRQIVVGDPADAAKYLQVVLDHGGKMSTILRTMKSSYSPYGHVRQDERENFLSQLPKKERLIVIQVQKQWEANLSVAVEKLTSKKPDSGPPSTKPRTISVSELKKRK